MNDNGYYDYDDNDHWIEIKQSTYSWEKNIHFGVGFFTGMGVMFLVCLGLGYFVT